MPLAAGTGGINMNSYIVIMSIYFIAMLVIGFLFSKKIKTKTDFYTARDKLNAAVIGMSYSATQMSGSSYMGTVGVVRSVGFAFVPSALTSAAAPWFTYILVGDRIRKIAARLQSITLVDIFEARYGKKASLSACVIMLVAIIPIITAQIKAAATAFEVLFGIPYVAGIFVFGGIVIIYTMAGGAFAVAWSDLIQGFLMMAGFAILAPVVLYQAGGFVKMHELYGQFNPRGLTVTGGMPVLWVISAFFLWGFFQIGGAPAAVTRFLATSNGNVLRKALVYSILFQSFIYITLVLIAFGSGALMPDLSPGQSDMALALLIQKYLPPIIGGIVLSAAMAAMMSTVDSVLLLAGSLFVHNIYNKAMKMETTPKQDLFIGRVVTFVIAIVSFLIAINPPAAVAWIIAIGFSLMAASFTFPMLLGLWWPKMTKTGGLVSILTGAVTCTIWYILSYVKYNSLSVFIGGIWPAMFGSAFSLVTLIIVSLLTPPIDKETAEIFYKD